MSLGVFQELQQFCVLFGQNKCDMSIRPSEIRLLDILCRVGGPHTPVSLAKCLGVSRPMISAHLSRLVNMGLVVRMSSPDDGRSFYVVATKKGKNVILQVNQNVDSSLDVLRKKLGAKKFESLVKLIIQANQAMKDVAS